MSAGGRTEYQWNKPVLNLMVDRDCPFIYGNHDGSRGEPKLDILIPDKMRVRDVSATGDVGRRV